MAKLKHDELRTLWLINKNIGRYYLEEAMSGYFERDHISTLLAYGHITRSPHGKDECLLSVTERGSAALENYAPSLPELRTTYEMAKAARRDPKGNVYKHRADLLNEVRAAEKLIDALEALATPVNDNPTSDGSESEEQP